jgi:hypothetical protein
MYSVPLSDCRVLGNPRIEKIFQRANATEGADFLMSGLSKIKRVKISIITSK